ncbi:MAG TPA: glycosyltransferase family 4 protein [Chroococcales cyanobacterium]
MAGPAIRCLELGRQLARDCEVTVFSPAAGSEPLPPEEKLTVVAGGSRGDLSRLAAESDTYFIQANVLKRYPELGRQDKFLAVDLYDPYLFSLLVQYKDEPVTASSSYRLMHQVLENHMLRADFCVCASERQRDYWLGRFCAQGRIDPPMYNFDPSLRKLIDVVPFGLSDSEPVLREHGIKKGGAIKETDRVLVWGGGVWDWFDPLTVIKAVAKISEKRDDVKLFFLGTKSPNAQVDLMDMAVRARNLASELKILNENVFFSEEWVRYEERANYLLDADIAVSAHFDLIETRFSFRTRILDYFWAGLPILTTAGDQLAELIESNAAGLALPYQDVDAWVAGILRILDDKQYETKCRQASKELSRQFIWSKAAEPLRAFARNPHHLPRFTEPTMPSLLERAHAVYSRGGKELILRRSKEILKDFLR